MTVSSESHVLSLENHSLSVTVPQTGLLSYESFKRLIDVVGGIIGIIILSPVMLVVAMLIKLDSTGPVFADIPKRVGMHGKMFKFFKFRSMFVGAHDMLHSDPKFKDLLEKYKQNSYKLSINEDPRITRVGKFIRKTSIDELPQFFNILKGEMSLVGPRAYHSFELNEQQQRFPKTREYIKLILTVKPGLTGVWQTSGRSGIDFEKRAQMDAEYAQRKSILFDLWLILKTIPAVLSRRGAV